MSRATKFLLVILGLIFVSKRDNFSVNCASINRFSEVFQNTKSDGPTKLLIDVDCNCNKTDSPNSNYDSTTKSQNLDLVLKSGVTLRHCINELTGLATYTNDEYDRLQQVRRIVQKLMEFKFLGEINALTGIDPRISDKTIESTDELSACSNLLYEGDIMLTPEEMDMVVTWAMEYSGVTFAQLHVIFDEHYQFLPGASGNRKKRQLNSDTDTRWSFPITYRINSDVTTSAIKSALNVWTSETCVTFKQSTLSLRQLKGNYINFKKGDSCSSTVGKKAKTEGQSIILTSECIENKYSIVHEIGHALGLWHEHSRSDRSSRVTINEDNIEKNYLSEFSKASSSDLSIINSYDHGSVMHYKSTAFGKTKKSKTIEASETKNQLSMGQRQQLAFSDAKAINEAYCSSSCSSKLNCAHNGYTDPNDCDKCKCPQGFSGTLCKSVQSSSSSKCGGELTASSSKKEVSVSGTAECYWLIKSSGTVSVQITSMNFACLRTCKAYVELKIGSDFGLTGGRFCCEKPSGTIKSSSSKAVIIYQGKSKGELTFTYST